MKFCDKHKDRGKILMMTQRQLRSYVAVGDAEKPFKKTVEDKTLKMMHEKVKR
jgi:hypothetical protein